MSDLRYVALIHVKYIFFVNCFLFTGIFAHIYVIMTSRKSKEPCTEGVEAFVRGMVSEVNAADVSRMMTLQQHMYVTDFVRHSRGMRRCLHYIQV